MPRQKLFTATGAATVAAVVVSVIILTLAVARLIRWAILRPLRWWQENSNDVVLSDTARAVADHNDLVVARWISLCILIIGLVVAFGPKLKDYLTG